ncbi:MAG: M23 family metallopeptidase, partial [Firmicutes bacterium]|nr:M23 family metallopeptidase [Bacillota bacterium]
VDDTLVGIIKNTDITGEELYDTAVAKLKSDTGTNIEVNEHISLKPVHASSDDTVTEDYILKEICANMTYKAEATAIYVNGEQVAVVSNEEEAKEILSEVAKRCLGLDSSQEAPKDPQFVQEVVMHPKFVSSDELMPKEKVIDFLSADTTENKTYTVQDGDTLFYIAGKFEISTDELIKANPSIGDGSNLTVGQTLKLVVPVPFLSVKTTEEVSYKESVAREVKQIQNPEEYLTYSNIITEGSDGEKEVTAKITKVNGIETSREIISEKITVEPVTQEIEVGTMETPPKRALGNFIYPVQGTLSSGYGARWGTFHHGIDLAAPYGMPVYASDGGTVVFAGYDNGGYGNLVVIDHGNGYTTKYAHNSSVAVEAGQQVAQGELIAYVGSTGDSTGNHCHFEVLVNGQSQDPFGYLG